jgi:hypothetical protein
MAEVKKHQCDLCSRTYLTRKYLLVHKKARHDGVRYKCDLCEREYVTKTGKERHMRSFHEKETHECNSCGKLFRYKSNMISHTKHVCNTRRQRSFVITNPVTRINTVKCLLCGKNISSGYLTRHITQYCREMIAKHRWYCNLCNSSVALTDKVSHMKSNHSDIVTNLV